MIVEETFYAVQCDICKDQSEDYDGIAFYVEVSVAENEAMEGEWHEDNGKHYCRKCHSFNDNDELVLNMDRKKI